MRRALLFLIFAIKALASIDTEVAGLISEHPTYFAGTVKGHSMDGYYSEGDTLIVKPIEYTKIKLGQVVVYTNKFGYIKIIGLSKS